MIIVRLSAAPDAPRAVGTRAPRPRPGSSVMERAFPAAWSISSRYMVPGRGPLTGGGVQDSFAKGRPYRPLLDEVDTDAESIARSAFGAGQVDERELQVRVGLIVEVGLAVSVLFPEGLGAEEFDGYDTVIVPDFRDPGAEHRPDLSRDL